MEKLTEQEKKDRDFSIQLDKVSPDKWIEVDSFRSMSFYGDTNPNWYDFIEKEIIENNKILKVEYKDNLVKKIMYVKKQNDLVLIYPWLCYSLKGGTNESGAVFYLENKIFKMKRATIDYRGRYHTIGYAHDILSVSLLESKYLI